MAIADRGKYELPDYLEMLQWMHERPNWCADAKCFACGFSWEVRVQDWIRCPNPPHRVGDLKARLKCEKCNGPVRDLIPRMIASRS
jgi:hypothetical protein